jgi:hypothetical protein
LVVAMTTVGAEVVAATAVRDGVLVPAPAVVEELVVELLPQPASRAPAMASAHAAQIVVIRFTFHSLGRLVRCRDDAHQA